MTDHLLQNKIKLAEVGPTEHGKLRSVLAYARRVGYDPKMIAEQLLWHSVSPIFESGNGSQWLSILKEELPGAYSIIDVNRLTSNVIYSFDIDALKILVQHPSFEIFNIPSSFNPLKADGFCQFHDQFIPLLGLIARDDQARVKHEFLNKALSVYSDDVNYLNTTHILSSGHRISENALSWINEVTRDNVLSTILAFELENSFKLMIFDKKDFDITNHVSTMSL